MVILTLAVGCARSNTRDTYLVALEAPFWRAVSEAYPELEADLRVSVLADGRGLSIAHLGADEPLDALHARLSRTRHAGVVLTPLLSLQAERGGRRAPRPARGRVELDR